MIKLITLIFALLALSLSGCSNNIPTNGHGKIMVLSLSSDGRYVISTDMSRHAVLWDLKQHTRKVVASKINIYSAYFIKNTNTFMYQDNTNNEVIIRNTDGKTIKKLQPGFPTYGQIITSDLQTYFASDDSFNIFKIHNDTKKKIFYYYCPPDLPKPLPKMGTNSIYGCMSFEGAGKLFNLTLANQDNMMIGSSYGYVLLWDTKTGNLVKQIQKNSAQTFATTSPDNKYIISGDIGAGGLIISMDKNYKAHNFFFLTPKKPEILNFLNATKQNTTDIVSIKFIDKYHIIVIYDSSPYPFNYATLYSINDIKNIRKQHPDWSYGYILNPIKYLNLLTPNKPDQPYPITQSNVRDQAIDTSPTAHILVMAQAHNNGILVYKYDPKTQTLKQIWAPVIKTPWWHIW